MAKKKTKTNAPKAPEKKAEPTFDKALDVMKKKQTDAAPAQGKAALDEPLTGFNRIPHWLRKEKRLPDSISGAIVVTVSGLVLILITYLFILIWPAGSG